MMRSIATGIALVAVLESGGRAEVKPGTMLGPETAEQARGLLPDEILARYKSGEFRHEVVAPKAGTRFIDPAFVAAGEANRGRYRVSEAGTIIDPATGKQPTYIYGPPFPDIDPNDPQAGVKVVWNFFYQSYVLGDSRNLIGLAWVAHDGSVDREVRNEVLQRFFDGQAPNRPRPDNPNNLLFQQFVEVLFPNDLRGTLSLTWRYRDTKRDNTWSYVPALRRVRAVSPTNRSDGFLGSDMSQDDGSYFDGKPEDFQWRLVGTGEMLCLHDRTAVVEGRHDVRSLPGGGFRAVYPKKPRFAWQQAGGGLAGWAPLPERTALVRHRVYLVEGTPRDRYYLYGKLALRFKQDGYSGCYNSKSDWRGEVLNTYTPLQGSWFEVVKGVYRQYSESQFTMSQNFKLNRGTTSYPFDDPSNPSDSLVTHDAALFSYEKMIQRGR
jgi:hypothetical protein